MGIVKERSHEDICGDEYTTLSGAAVVAVIWAVSMKVQALFEHTTRLSEINM